MPKKILIEKLITRSLFIIAWFVFWGFCYFYYSKSDVLLTPNSTNPLFIMILVVVVALPFGLTKFFQIIFSRTGDGVIVDVKQNLIPDSSLKNIISKRYNTRVYSLNYMQVVDAHVQMDDGKIIVRRFNEKTFNYYNIGDCVRIYKGIDFFEKLDKSKDKSIICLKCGHINDMKKEKCFHCGKVLYKGEHN
jgi:hypothetical protein